MYVSSCLRTQKAHCIEGGMLTATVALMRQGEKPLLLNLKSRQTRDDDHVWLLSIREMDTGCDKAKQTTQCLRISRSRVQNYS